MFTFTGPNDLETTGTLSLVISAATSTAYSLSSLYDRTPDAPLTFTAGTGVDIIHHSLTTQTPINFIALQNINFKNFRVMVNSATVTPLVSTGGTTASYWTTWSATNLWLKFATMTALTIQIDVWSTGSGGNRQIGQLIVGEEKMALSRNPNYSQYKPVLTGMRQTKKTADGGMVTYRLASTSKFNATIDLQYLDQATRDLFYTWWKTGDTRLFIPFPTGTSWDGEIREVNYVNDFELYNLALNNRLNPLYRGSVKIAETPLR